MAGGNFGGGDGTASSPFLVQDALDFLAIFNRSNGEHFLQTSDIDMTGHPVSHPSITNASAVASFRGFYDGGGRELRNVTLLSVGNSYVSLFGKPVVNNTYPTVKDLVVRIAHAESSRVTAGFFSVCTSRVTIENCHVYGDLLGSTVGGFIGIRSGTQLSGLKLYKCSFTGSLLGTDYAGGLIAYWPDPTTLEYCHFDGSIDTTGNFAGGLYGSCKVEEMKYCYSKGSVKSSGSSGGLGSSLEGLVSDCFSTCDVVGDKLVGGLFGTSSFNRANSRIERCYASGAISGNDNVGGISGKGYISTAFGGVVFESVFALNGSITRTGGEGIFFGDFVGNVEAINSANNALDASNIENCYALDSMSIVGL